MQGILYNWQGSVPLTSPQPKGASFAPDNMHTFVSTAVFYQKCRPCIKKATLILILLTSYDLQKTALC